MSRIGKQPVSIPKGVTFNFSKENHTVTIKGPKGELKQLIDSDFQVKQEEGSVLVERPTEQKRHKAMHGLYRALIANMVEGVSNGYKAQLELVGQVAAKIKSLRKVEPYKGKGIRFTGEYVRRKAGKAAAK